MAWPSTLAELERELADFDRETEERRAFRTELKDLREGLTDSPLRGHLGPFLVRVEKFALDFVREPADAERARSLFSPGRPSSLAFGPSRCGAFPAASRWPLRAGAALPDASVEGGKMLVAPGS
jgi:hypothetical protein